MSEIVEKVDNKEEVEETGDDDNGPAPARKAFQIHRDSFG
eukprot:gene41399-51263_t